MLKRGKRILATVLSMAIFVNACFPAFAQINPAYPDVIDYTVTDNELVAYYYGANSTLDAAEIELLSKDELVNGDSHRVIRPKNDDGALVTINQEEQKVEAEKFTDSNGNVWEPVSAVLNEEGTNITLDGNGEGEFTTSLDNYSIKVTYQLKIAVAEDVQKALLNTPAILKEGVNNLTTVNGAYDYIAALQNEAMPQLIELATTGVTVGSTGLSFKLFADTTVLKTVAEGGTEGNLREDYEDDDKLSVIKMLGDYRAVGSDTAAKLTYLLSTTDRIDKAAISLYNDVKALYDSLMNSSTGYTFFQGLKDSGVISETEFGKITVLKTLLENILSSLESVQYEWGIFTETHAVKDGVDMAALATAVDKLSSTTRHTADVSQIPADSVSVDANVNRVDVVLEITGEVASSTSESKLEQKEVVSNAAAPVKVSKGETKERYLGKLKETGLLADTLAAWGMDEDHYSVEITNEDSLPETAEEAITVKVLVTPIWYKVTEKDFGGVVDVPYGYEYKFAANEDAEKAYIYTIDGVKYEQNSTYTVVGDVTVTRESDRAKTTVKVNYAIGTTIGANDNEMAVLTSDAIPSDTIRVKYPNNTDNDTIGLTKYTKGSGVVAKAYVSGYENNWVPYSVTFNDAAGTVKYFGEPVEGEYIVEFTGEATSAVVEYRLAVDISSTEATTIANYPYVLSAEAKQQQSQMNKLAGQRGTIDENIGKIILMGSLIKDASYNFSADALAAWNEFEDTCLDVNKKLKLSTYLDNYANGGGLVYYYTGGYEEINSQIPALKALCEALASEENQAPLANVAGMVGYTYDFIKESLDDVVATLNDSELVAPNPIINVNSSELSSLLKTLVAGGMSEKATVSEVYLTTPITAKVDGEATVILKVSYKGKEYSSGSISVSSIEKLTQAKIDEIMTNWDGVIAEAKIDEEHYYYAGEETDTTPLTEGEYPKSITYTRTWKPVEYSVTVNGEATDITFTYNGADQQITLEGPTSEGERYTYSVAGKTATAVKGQKATLSLKVSEVDSAAVAAGTGKYTINVTRTTEDMSVVNFVEFAGEMNSAFATSDVKAAFMPFEVTNGTETEKVLVMRATYTGGTPDMNSLMSPLEKVLGDYNYVAMGSNEVISEQKISIQGIMDEFINKGFGMNTIDDLIDDKGNINELKLDNAVALIDLSSIENPTVLGGKLIETTLSFGASAETATTVKFYITLEDFDTQSAKLKKADSLIAKLSPHININSVNDKVQIDMNMPEDVYALYLTYMLAEQEITLDSFNDVELETLLTYAEDVTTELIGDLADGEEVDADRFFTALVLENTINQFAPSKTPDLDEYGSMLKKLVKYTDLILTEVERENGVYDGSNYTVDVKTDDVEALLDKINPLAKSFVADKEIVVPTSLTLKNVDTDYQAYIVKLPEDKNITKAELKETLKLSKDITADLKAVSGNTLVVLLGDAALTEDVVIKGKNVVIDLNGFTLTGNVTADADVRLVDDTMTTLNAGGINGNVSGNFTIYAGNYSADVTSMVPEGYTVVSNNGMNCVRNAAYLLNESGDEYQILLHSDVFDSTKASLENSVVNALVNVAANLYGYNNAATADGEMLYTFGSNSAVDMMEIVKGGKDAIVNELLGYVGIPAIETITNDLLDQLKAIMNGTEGIKEGEALLSVELKLEPWNFEYSVSGTGDDAYIDVAYTGDSDNAVTKTLSFCFEDEKMVEMTNSIIDVVEVTTAEVTLGDEIVWNGGKNFSLDHSGKFDVTLDLTSDVNYSIILTTILANNQTDKTEYVDAVNKYIAEGKVGDIKERIDKTRINELVAALKNASGKSFAAMVDNMGYTGVDEETLVELESKYSFVLDTLYKLLIKLDVTGTSTKLSSYDEGTEYTISKTAYGVDGTVRVKLFSADPEITKLVPNYAYVGDGKQIYRFYLDETDKSYGTDGLLILDTRIDGVTVEELENFFGFDAINYDNKYLTVDEAYISTVELVQGNERDVIVSGAQFTIVAENNSGAKDTRTYTLIILGDTSSSGTIEVGDATIICRHAMEGFELTAEQLIAGDANMDRAEEPEVGDCVQICKKWVSESTDPAEAEYVSSMDNTHIKND